jgi:UDP-N-acetylglucosamine--N-acetylmuramyl-(pentapeptide) pyrophosphoryl-undecaprenol N-acetylglucosamine transferase
MTAASVMLAAGGTGGHLFPALALAEELARRALDVDLVTDGRGDRYGADFPARAVYRVPSATFAGRSPLGAARTGLTLLRGVGAAVRLIGKLKPAAVVGFGGYPSFPPLVAARLRGVPAALHEQNAVLGRANRMLAPYVTAVATSFQDTKLLGGSARSRARFVGNPVRDRVLALAQTAYEEPVPGAELRLLVFGGSQGARFFSEAVPPALALLPPELQARLSVVQQCREEDLRGVEDAYRRHGIKARLAPFFADLPEEMAKAHLVIGRSGASTVAELTVIGRPAILVPLPHAIDNDQKQNAMRLAESGGAWCIDQRDLSPQHLSSAVGRLLASPPVLVAAAAAAKRQGRPDAVARLADLVEELIGSPPKSA